MMEKTKYQAPSRQRIDGVVVHDLKVIPDERGRLMEIVRRDHEFFGQFGQVYLTTNYPGVVKAWHYHKVQTDCFTCVRGMIKAVLYDDRPDSPTNGIINEFFIGDHNHQLIVIPPGIYHGWKCISEIESLVVNIPTEPYNYHEPDEFREDPHHGKIPYDWARHDG